MNRARFLLAQLHMDSLRDKTSPKLIKKALEILPKGSNALDLAYDGAMQRIEGQMEGFRLRAKQLLGWLTYSERLMTVKQIQHALAIEPGTPDLDEDNLSDVNEIVALCAGLIIIDEETQIIRLVHYTTQEYFRQNGDKLFACAQQDIATSCLTYLLYEKFGDGWVVELEQEESPEQEEDKHASRNGGGDGDGNEDGAEWEEEGEDERDADGGNEGDNEDEAEYEVEVEDEDVSWRVKARLLRYPFLRYAARYWAIHAILCGQRNVKDLTMSFVKDNRRVSSATQVILALDRCWYFDVIDGTKSHAPLSAIHFVAYLGHEEMISELLSHGFDADAKDSSHQTPLWWAASQGHEAVVSLLLLQSHVNVNNRGLALSDKYGGETFGTSLGIAAAEGKDKIVKLLIQREDVDVNLPNEAGESPLFVPIERGYSKVVELLLTRRDIEVNSRNTFGKTPLCVAARFDDNIAQQLLEQKDIQVNLADNNGWTPLAWAAWNGNESVMEALLGCSDIELNAPATWGETPLFKAVRWDQEAAVKLLLSRSDVDVNWKDNNGATVLHQAAQRGFTPIVRILTSRVDIDVNLKDKFGRTALYKAAAQGFPDTVELLLACIDIDVNSEDEDGRTPLHKAVEGYGLYIGKDKPWYDDRSDEEAKQGCESVVALLLDFVGINVNPKDHEGKTPLAKAIISRHAAAARLLCAHPDVDLDPRDKEARGLFALIEEEQEQDWSSEFEDEETAGATLELDECIEILRTAIETRSRNRHQDL